jgi:hypothetical protein
MARAANQIQRFRSAASNFLDALNALTATAKTIDYLGGLVVYGPELDKVDAENKPIYDISKVQMTNAITAVGSINALLEADTQVIGKRLSNMRE